MQNYENNNTKKHKYIYNFFLTREEKDLIFALKNLHKLNNKIGNDNQSYTHFITEMTAYYKNILGELPID